jgi:hypothetical protein
MPNHGYEKKTTRQATKSPTVRDLAWAAGFLEGEGSFQSMRGQWKDKVYYSPCVRASQMEKEPLQFLVEIFGGTLKQYSNRGFKKRKCWAWGAYGSRARGIMMTLYGMLSAKRQTQIRKALADHKNHIHK